MLHPYDPVAAVVVGLGPRLRCAGGDRLLTWGLLNVYTSVYTQNMPKKPMVKRMIRVPEGLWERAKAKADERDETVSEAVRKFLERYAK